MYAFDRKQEKGISLYTPVLLYKSGVKGGIFYTDMLSRCLELPSFFSIVEDILRKFIFRK